MFGIDDIAAGMIIGSLVAGATAAGTTAYNASAASTANNTSYSQSREMAQWQATQLPKLKVQGLRDAGLNPILGYDSLGSASVPVFNAQAGAAGDFSQIGRILSKLPEVSSADALRKSEIRKNNETLDAQVASMMATVENSYRQTQSNIDEANSRIALNNAKTMEVLGETNSAKALNSLNSAREHFYRTILKPKFSVGLGKNYAEWYEDPYETVVPFLGQEFGKIGKVLSDPKKNPLHIANENSNNSFADRLYQLFRQYDQSNPTQKELLQKQLFKHRFKAIPRKDGTYDFVPLD